MAAGFILRSRHGTVFHFRRRVPKDLVERLGRTHIVVSLRSAVCGQARERARVLAARTDQLFSELHYMAKGKKLTTFRLDYGMGIELDPLTGKLAKIHITDAKPEEQPAIDRHIETVIAATARNGVPQVLPAPETPRWPRRPPRFSATRD